MITKRTIRDWIKGWRIDEDGFFACDSGTNRVRRNLDEPDVKGLCTKWWMENAPCKDELILLIFVTVNALFFAVFLRISV